VYVLRKFLATIEKPILKRKSRPKRLRSIRVIITTTTITTIIENTIKRAQIKRTKSDGKKSTILLMTRQP
jgi:predicted secreted protein